MKQHPKEILDIVDTPVSEELESLALPAEFDGIVYQAAADLAEAYSQDSITDQDLRAKIVTHREKLLRYLVSFYLPAARGKKEEGCPKKTNR